METAREAFPSEYGARGALFGDLTFSMRLAKRLFRCLMASFSFVRNSGTPLSRRTSRDGAPSGCEPADKQRRPSKRPRSSGTRFLPPEPAMRCASTFFPATPLTVI